MSTEQNQLSLYIVRCETYQTEEYISNVFHLKRYGKVKDIEFVSKTNTMNGQTYNGAIVTFANWYLNANSETLLSKIIGSNDAFKFYHNDKQYWLIKEHKVIQKSSNNEEDTNTNTNNNFEIAKDMNNMDKDDKIIYLENLVLQLKSQLILSQKKIENFEIICMENEEKINKYWFENLKLHSKIDDLTIENLGLSFDSKQNI